MLTTSTKIPKIVFICLLVSFLFAACTPSLEEKAIPTRATTIAPTIPAAVTSTLLPPRVLTNTPTPKATYAPTEDLLAWNTPDPFSVTQTPSPRATSTPLDNPVSRISEWPALENDVLFLVDNSLQLWDHVNGELVLLLASTAVEVPNDDSSSLPNPGEITDYQVSPNGQTVIVSRVITVEPRIQEFILIDLTTFESRTLIPPSRIWNPSFSPDGRQIAYLNGDREEISTNEGAEIYDVMVKNIFEEDPPQIINNCVDKEFEGDRLSVWVCQHIQIVWSPDGRSLQWSDKRGVVSHNLDTGQIETIKTHENMGLSGPAQLSSKTYLPKDWSPSGLFLRLDASGYEYFEEFIYDLDSRQLFEIPNSYGGLGPEKYTIWLSDDRIFQARPLSYPYETHADILRFDTTIGDWVLESSYIFSTRDDNYPTVPTQFEDGSVGLVTLDRQETSFIANFHLSKSLADGNLQFIQLPTVVETGGFVDVYWSPHGNGAILVQQLGNVEYSVEYAAIGEEVVYELNFALGNNVTSIYWLP